jgi:hypothetical protein
MTSNTTDEPTDKDVQPAEQASTIPSETVTHSMSADGRQEEPAEEHMIRRDRLSRKPFGAAFWVSVVAATAAGFAALFTWMQVDVAKDTAQKELRAYVYAVPTRLFHLGASPTQGYLGIKNGGKTFARNVKRWAGINVLGPKISDAFDDLGKLVPEPGAMTLGPDSHTDATIICNFRVLTPDEVDQIKSGEKRIYVFGKITYEDMFGLPHETTFCFVYYGSETASPPDKPGYLDFQAKYCDRHNHAN